MKSFSATSWRLLFHLHNHWKAWLIYNLKNLLSASDVSQKCCCNQGQPERDGQRSANSTLRIYASFPLAPPLTEQMTVECSLCVRLRPGLREVCYKQDKIHALKSLASITGDLLSKLLFMKTQEVSFFLWDRVLCTRSWPPPCYVAKARPELIRLPPSSD